MVHVSVGVSFVIRVTSLEYCDITRVLRKTDVIASDLFLSATPQLCILPVIPASILLIF